MGDLLVNMAKLIKTRDLDLPRPMPACPPYRGNVSVNLLHSKSMRLPALAVIKATFPSKGGVSRREKFL